MVLTLDGPSLWWSFRLYGWGKFRPAVSWKWYLCLTPALLENSSLVSVNWFPIVRGFLHPPLSSLMRWEKVSWEWCIKYKHCCTSDIPKLKSNKKIPLNDYNIVYIKISYYIYHELDIWYMYLEQFWETHSWRHINHKSLQLYNWLRNPTHLTNPLYMR